MFIAESFIRLGQRGFLGRRKETDLQSRAVITPGWGYIVRREWRAAAPRLIHYQYLAGPDPPYSRSTPMYIYISSARKPLSRMRIPGMSSVMHLCRESHKCCTLQGYTRLLVVALASIRTAHYSGMHELFVDRGNVSRYVLTCLLVRIFSLRLRVEIVCIVHVHLMCQAPASTCTVRYRSMPFY